MLKERDASSAGPVSGYFLETDGVYLAVTSDERFVTQGATRGEALAAMNDLLVGYTALAKTYGFESFRKLSERPFALSEADRWELQPA